MSQPEGNDWIESFIEDGHVVHVSWVRDSIAISKVDCPFDDHGRSGICNRLRERCAVRTFIGVFGPELNIGEIEVMGPIEIAWSPVHGECDLDREFAGLWIVPLSDPDYLTAKANADNDM